MPEKSIDYEDDANDGILFRFWIRMASYPGGSPSKLLDALGKMDRSVGSRNVTPADYRRALTELAKSEGVNFQ